jgi:hypothetical protein
MSIRQKSKRKKSFSLVGSALRGRWVGHVPGELLELGADEAGARLDLVADPEVRERFLQQGVELAQVEVVDGGKHVVQRVVAEVAKHQHEVPRRRRAADAAVGRHRHAVQVAAVHHAVELRQTPVAVAAHRVPVVHHLRVVVARVDARQREEETRRQLPISYRWALRFWCKMQTADTKSLLRISPIIFKSKKSNQ